MPDVGADAQFLWVAALLSLERLTYAAVWRAPNAFRRWSARHARQQSPIDTLAALFVGFKVLQAAVFVGWCLIHADGDLRPYSSDVQVAGGIVLIASGQLLNLSVFRALGKTGVFYGNRLGQPVPWQRRFPFTWFEHPQYPGHGYSPSGDSSSVMRFPAHDWLFIPVLETVYYAVGAYFERDSVPTDGRLARAKE